MKPCSVIDGDLGFTYYETDAGTFAIDLTVVAGLVVDEPATVYESESESETLVVFNALRYGLVSSVETAGMVAALRMADDNG